MKVLNIQNSIDNNALSCKKKTLTFTATPEQIFAAARADGAEICPQKADFLMAIAGLFKEVRKGLAKTNVEQVSYKLGKQNDVPKALENKKEGYLWNDIDEIFEGSAFAKFHCSCYKGKTIGDFAKDALEKLGVDNPSEITLNKPHKKKFLGLWG